MVIFLGRRETRPGRKENAEELIRLFGEKIVSPHGMIIENGCMQYSSVGADSKTD